MTLELAGVHAYYGRSHVLHGVSLAAAAGEVISLLGRNGAGKSTTLKAIMGLVRVGPGTIRVDGRDVTGRPTREISRLGVGFVPEDRRIFADLTVLENLRVGARRDGWTIERALDFFPMLRTLLGRRGESLSGGEQQMLTIARTLMGGPRLLLLDEPSLGLAPLIVTRIFEVIQQLNKEGTTILLVEQNARSALKLANRGYVMETGNITMTDDAKKLLEDERVKSAYLGDGH